MGKLRQYIEAHGEVFYTEDGILKRMEAKKFFDMIEEEKRIASIYFEITIGKDKYKLNITNRKMILHVLSTIDDVMERAKETYRYLKMCEEAGV